MSVTIQTRIIGDAAVRRAITKLEKEMPIVLRKLVTTAALVGENFAKNAAPIVTGRLRTSITHAISGGQGNKLLTFTDRKTGKVGNIRGVRAPTDTDKNKTRGIIGTNVVYAKAVEFKSKPFLFPALKIATRRLILLLRTEIKKI